MDEIKVDEESVNQTLLAEIQIINQELLACYQKSLISMIQNGTMKTLSGGQYFTEDSLPQLMPILNQRGLQATTVDQVIDILDFIYDIILPKDYSELRGNAASLQQKVIAIKGLNVESYEEKHDMPESRLCTFNETQTNFRHQPWYQCVTCGLTGNQGACSVCIEHCHKGHDVFFSKWSNFYCDCPDQGKCSKLSSNEAISIPQLGKMFSTDQKFFDSDEEMKEEGQKEEENKDIQMIAPKRKEKNIYYLKQEVAKLIRMNLPLERFFQIATDAQDEMDIQTGCQDKADTVILQDSCDLASEGKYIATGTFNLTKTKCVFSTQPTTGISSYFDNNIAYFSDPYFLGRETGEVSGVQNHIIAQTKKLGFQIKGIQWNPFNEKRVAMHGERGGELFVIEINNTFGKKGQKMMQQRINVNVGTNITDVKWVSDSKLAVATLDHVKFYDLSHDSISPEKVVYTEGHNQKQIAIIGNSIKSITDTGILLTHNLNDQEEFSFFPSGEENVTYVSEVGNQWMALCYKETNKIRLVKQDKKVDISVDTNICSYVSNPIPLLQSQNMITFACIFHNTSKGHAVPMILKFDEKTNIVQFQKMKNCQNQSIGNSQSISIQKQGDFLLSIFDGGNISSYRLAPHDKSEEPLDSPTSISISQLPRKVSLPLTIQEKLTSYSTDPQLRQKITVINKELIKVFKNPKQVIDAISNVAQNTPILAVPGLKKLTFQVQANSKDFNFNGIKIKLDSQTPKTVHIKILNRDITIDSKGPKITTILFCEAEIEYIKQNNHKFTFDIETTQPVKPTLSLHFLEFLCSPCSSPSPITTPKKSPIKAQLKLSRGFPLLSKDERINHIPKLTDRVFAQIFDLTQDTKAQQKQGTLSSTNDFVLKAQLRALSKSERQRSKSMLEEQHQIFTKALQEGNTLLVKNLIKKQQVTQYHPIEDVDKYLFMERGLFIDFLYYHQDLTDDERISKGLKAICDLKDIGSISEISYPLLSHIDVKDKDKSVKAIQLMAKCSNDKLVKQYVDSISNKIDIDPCNKVFQQFICLLKQKEQITKKFVIESDFLYRSFKAIYEHFQEGRGTIKLINDQVVNEVQQQDLLLQSDSQSSISNVTYDQDIAKALLQIISFSKESKKSGQPLNNNDEIARLLCLIITKHPLQKLLNSECKLAIQKLISPEQFSENVDKALYQELRNHIDFVNGYDYIQTMTFVTLLDRVKRHVKSREAKWREFGVDMTQKLVNIALNGHSVLQAGVLYLVAAIAIKGFTQNANEILKENDGIQTDKEMFNILQCKDIQQIDIGGKEIISQLIDILLLNSNSIIVRRLSALIVSSQIMSHANSDPNSSDLIYIMKSKLPNLITFGKNSKEFLHLLSSTWQLLNMSSLPKFLKQCLDSTSNSLQNHPNYPVYNDLYTITRKSEQLNYLEESPCLQCYLESKFKTDELSMLVKEKKNSHSSQMWKFMNPYEINELKINVHSAQGGKYIDQIMVYVNKDPRKGLSDLKGNWKEWTKVYQTSLPPMQSSGSREIGIKFTIPLTAVNFMVEFSASKLPSVIPSSLEKRPDQDPFMFGYSSGKRYNAQNELLFSLEQKELVMCPRCAKPVDDKNGHCNQCQENAYQCQYCRNINYEFLDAFLCNECGLSKYCKIDYQITYRKGIIIPSIANDQDRDESETQLNSAMKSLNENSIQVIKAREQFQQMLIPGSENDDEESFGHRVLDLYDSIIKPAQTEMNRSYMQAIGIRKEVLIYNKEIVRVVAEQEDMVVDSQVQDREIAVEGCYGCILSFLQAILDFISVTSQQHQSDYSNILPQLRHISRFYDPKVGIQAKKAICYIGAKNKEYGELVLNQCKSIIHDKNTTDKTIEEQLEIMVKINIFSHEEQKETSQQTSKEVFDISANELISIFKLLVQQGREALCSGVIKRINEFIDLDFFGACKDSSSKPLKLDLPFVKEIIKCLLCKTSKQSRVDAKGLILRVKPELVISELNQELQQAMESEYESTEFFEVYESLLTDNESQVTNFDDLEKAIKQQLEKFYSQEQLRQKLGTQGVKISVTLGQGLLNIMRITQKFFSLDSIIYFYFHICKLKLIKNENLNELMKLLSSQITKSPEQEKIVKICVELLKDMHSDKPSLYEQLNRLINPPKVVKNYDISINKAASQDIYIRGNMPKHIYKQSEVGATVGDMKSYIGKEMELDPDLLELLIGKKLVALELPLQAVYEQVWFPQSYKSGHPNIREIPSINDVEQANLRPMQVTFRLAGLDGEATEDRVEKVDGKGDQQEIKQDLVKILIKGEGIKFILQDLSETDVVEQRIRTLNILKLLSYASKEPESFEQISKYQGTQILVEKLFILLPHTANPDINTSTNIVLELLEVLVTKNEITLNDPSGLHVKQLLEKIINEESIQDPAPHQIIQACKILPYLSKSNSASNQLIAETFAPYIPKLTDLHEESKADQQKQIKFYIERLVDISESATDELKEFMQTKGIVPKLCMYLKKNAGKVTDFVIDNIGQSLTFALNLLKNILPDHPGSQRMVLKTQCFDTIYKLSQAKLENRQIGILADELIHALAKDNGKNDPDVAKVIKGFIEGGLAAKKAMAEEKKKQMMAKFGQKKISEKMQKMVDEVKTESGLRCIICQEGYELRPSEVLCIYVFNKHIKSRVSEGKSITTSRTTTHFTTIHQACHHSAFKSDQKMRQPKGEWEGATIRNSHTKCNNLLPLRGGDIPKDFYEGLLQKYYRRCMDNIGANSARDGSLGTQVLHDIKSVFVQLAYEESFSIDSQGGGPEHNISFIPFLVNVICEELEFYDQFDENEQNVQLFHLQLIQNMFSWTPAKLKFFREKAIRVAKAQEEDKEQDPSKLIEAKKQISAITSSDVSHSERFLKFMKPLAIMVNLVQRYSQMFLPKETDHKKILENTKSFYVFYQEQLKLNTLESLMSEEDQQMQ